MRVSALSLSGRLVGLSKQIEAEKGDLCWYALKRFVSLLCSEVTKGAQEVITGKGDWSDALAKHFIRLSPACSLVCGRVRGRLLHAASAGLASL